MGDRDFQNVDDKTLNKMLKGQKVIDLGEITIENEKDRKLLDKYIEALKEGNDLYKPGGLKIKKRS